MNDGGVGGAGRCAVGERAGGLLCGGPPPAGGGGDSGDVTNNSPPVRSRRRRAMALLRAAQVRDDAMHLTERSDAVAQSVPPSLSLLHCHRFRQYERLHSHHFFDGGVSERTVARTKEIARPRRRATPAVCNAARSFDTPAAVPSAAAAITGPL